MNYDHNKKFGLLKFYSGYGKVYLNSPKGYSLKIINAQTGHNILFFFSAFVIINHSLGTVDISSATVQSVGTLETGIQFQCPAELPAACGSGAPR